MAYGHPRVKSHVPLKNVPNLITTTRVSEAIRLIDGAWRQNGIQHPRIAECGLCGRRDHRPFRFRCRSRLARQLDAALAGIDRITNDWNDHGI
jgi:Pyridoxal phosphate biosynthetic protein PdxA